MRFCKRTFFNVLLQPKRVGKPIFKRRYGSYVARIYDRRVYNSNKPFRPKYRIAQIQDGSTPKNLILGRYSRVRHFKHLLKWKFRTSQSVLVRRAKEYDRR